MYMYMYLKLWMGTHSKGPAAISHPETLSGQLLSEWIKSNSWALGEGVTSLFGNDQLPFLFKVLSINKALSIQAHPAKEHAQKLHQTSPELYRDPNHKPELAIAVSPFEGFCGFRVYEEIRRFVLGVAELRELVGEEVCMVMSEGVVDKRTMLRRAFTSLMERDEGTVKEKLERLLGRVQSGTAGEQFCLYVCLLFIICLFVIYYLFVCFVCLFIRIMLFYYLLVTSACKRAG